MVTLCRQCPMYCLEVKIFRLLSYPPESSFSAGVWSVFILLMLYQDIWISGWLLAPPIFTSPTTNTLKLISTLSYHFLKYINLIQEACLALLSFKQINCITQYYAFMKCPSVMNASGIIFVFLNFKQDMVCMVCCVFCCQICLAFSLSLNRILP